MVLSDHHPGTMTLLFPYREVSSKIWIIGLLADPGDLATIRQHIEEFFRLNNTPDIFHLTQWEAHKCVIRGHMLSIAARRKREHQKLIKDLSSKIHDLEAQHKHSHAIHLAQELAGARALLVEELFKRAHKRHMLTQRLFYEQGNKPGRRLARATQNQTLITTVHHVTDTEHTHPK